MAIDKGKASRKSAYLSLEKFGIVIVFQLLDLLHGFVKRFLPLINRWLQAVCAKHSR